MSGIQISAQVAIVHVLDPVDVAAWASAITAVATVCAAVAAGTAAFLASRSFNASKAAFEQELRRQDRSHAEGVIAVFDPQAPDRVALWNVSSTPIRTPIAYYFLDGVHYSQSDPMRSVLAPSATAPAREPSLRFVRGWLREDGIDENRISDIKIALYFTDTRGRRWKRGIDDVLTPDPSDEPAPIFRSNGR